MYRTHFYVCKYITAHMYRAEFKPVVAVVVVA